MLLDGQREVELRLHQTHKRLVTSSRSRTHSLSPSVLPLLAHLSHFHSVSIPHRIPLPASVLSSHRSSLPDLLLVYAFLLSSKTPQKSHTNSTPHAPPHFTVLLTSAPKSAVLHLFKTPHLTVSAAVCQRRHSPTSLSHAPTSTSSLLAPSVCKPSTSLPKVPRPSSNENSPFLSSSGLFSPQKIKVPTRRRRKASADPRAVLLRQRHWKRPRRKSCSPVAQEGMLLPRHGYSR